jgi:hypothetical protein
MTDDRIESFFRHIFNEPPSRFDWFCLILLLSLLGGCTTSSYSEMDQCPAYMDEEQKASGAVRCRAMCSSYGRDFDSFGDDCHCNCVGKVGSAYRPVTKKKAPPVTDRM